MDTVSPSPLIPLWYLSIPALVAAGMLYRVRYATTPVTVGSTTFLLLRLVLIALLFPILVHVLRLAVPGDGNNTAGLLLLASLFYMLPRLLPVLLPRVAFRAGLLGILALVVVDGVLFQFWFILPLPPAIVPEFTADLVVTGSLWVLYWMAMHYLKQPVAATPLQEAAATTPEQPMLSGDDKILQAAQAYMVEGEALQIKPTVTQFSQWLAELELAQRDEWVAMGMLAAWQHSFYFRRFVWQQQGYDYASFLAAKLDGPTFKRWVDATYT